MLTENEKKIVKLFEQHANNNYLNTEIIHNESYFVEENDYDYNELEYLQSIINNQSFDSIDQLNDHLTSILIDNEDDLIHYRIQEFVSEHYDELLLIDESYTEYGVIYDLITDDVIRYTVTTNTESIFNSLKVNTIIMLEPYEHRNMEYSCNNFFNMYQSLSYNNDQIENDKLERFYEFKNELDLSSCSTLLNKQGYSTDNLMSYEMSGVLNQTHPLDNDIVFNSIVQEITNASNTCALLVLRKLSLNEYSTLCNTEKEQPIKIYKNDTIGYFSPVDGSGSVFEIKLNHDMEYNKKEYKIYTENSLPGYTISETYGSFLID